MSAFVIARLTFREASRRWVLWAALLLGILFLVVFALGFNQMYLDMHSNQRTASQLLKNEMVNFMLQAGLYSVNFLTIIMTVLTSVDTLSGEIASGTIHTLLSKPVRRWEIVVGKWMGFSGMLTLYLLLMAGGVMAIVYLISDYTAPNALRGLGLMWINILLLLSVSLLGGAILSTLSNGVLVFGLYGVAFIGGWIEQIGSFMRNQTAVNIGILCSLLFPTETIWKRAAYEMQSPVVGAFGGFSLFTGQSTPSMLMVAYAILYAAAALFLAVRLFHKRDL